MLLASDKNKDMFEVFLQPKILSSARFYLQNSTPRIDCSKVFDLRKIHIFIEILGTSPF